jgi:XTP/dITP diphosphohydrolase
MVKTVHIATSNPAKVAWAVEQCAPHGIQIIPANVELIEPQADTVAEVSLAKARQAWDKLGRIKAVVVEDGGLLIPALQGFPGPYSKYILSTIGIEGILKLMDGLAGDARYAYYQNAVTFIGANGAEWQYVTEGYRGHIATSIWPPGDGTMWSAAWQIFIPLNFDKAMSQFSKTDWDECYKVNNYKPVFTTFAEWYGMQPMVAENAAAKGAA